MIVKLLTERHLGFLSLKEASQARVKMPHCWKSHATAHLYYCDSTAVIAAGKQNKIKNLVKNLAHYIREYIAYVNISLLTE